MEFYFEPLRTTLRDLLNISKMAMAGGNSRYRSFNYMRMVFSVVCGVNTLSPIYTIFAFAEPEKSWSNRPPFLTLRGLSLRRNVPDNFDFLNLINIQYLPCHYHGVSLLC